MHRLAEPVLRQAVSERMMQETILARDGKSVTLSNGQKATEFINCSYLGLDTHPNIIRGAKEAVEEAFDRNLGYQLL